MKSNSYRLVIFIAIAVMLVVLSQSANACPSCYGAAQSSRFDGMNAAILTMIGITGMVMAGFLSFIVSMRRRVRRAQHALAGEIQQGRLEWSNS